MPRLIAPLLCVAAIALALVASTHAVAAEPAPAAPVAAAQPPTAAALDAYLASKGSPMTGQGAAFVASGGQWQVDPRLVVAIAGAESSFGQITCAPVARIGSIRPAVWGSWRITTSPGRTSGASSRARSAVAAR